ncbi:MAG: nucleotidyltransferase family protein [Armatimonadetes bacterium]|nr:nucleotidyltransferase family protein [Armatimonadota bacterium]
MVDALVLSGGAMEKERFRGFDPAIARKAQIPILGRPMVEWTVRGLRSCPQIGRIIVVGDQSLDTPALRELDATVIPERGDISENLRAGLQALPDARRVLVLSGDLPLLTRAALEDLFGNAPEADVVFPYVERADVLRDFPNRAWIFAPTPEGAFTGCSAALVRPDVLRDRWLWVEELLNARRRKPWQLAMMFGFSFTLKLCLRRLRVADVEQKLSSLLHLVGRGYRTRFNELALDVDKYSDIMLVERVLQQRERVGSS